MMKPVQVQPVFLMYAFRYALGSATYAVGDVADTLEAYVDDFDALPVNWRAQIVRDITEAIDSQRAGMDIDVTRWKALADLLRATVSDEDMRTFG
jgi:hypothetical protein